MHQYTADLGASHGQDATWARVDFSSSSHSEMWSFWCKLWQIKAPLTTASSELDHTSTPAPSKMYSPSRHGQFLCEFVCHGHTVNIWAIASAPWSSHGAVVLFVSQSIVYHVSVLRYVSDWTWPINTHLDLTVKAQIQTFSVNNETKGDAY